MAEPDPATSTVGALRAGSEKRTSHCNHFRFEIHSIKYTYNVAVIHASAVQDGESVCVLVHRHVRPMCLYINAHHTNTAIVVAVIMYFALLIKLQ